MPKGSVELTKARKDEIIAACAKLYETMSFKDITIKEIGSVTSFTRTSIYNYFQTKEEIFLALLQQEYECWNSELTAALEEKASMTRAEFAVLLADTISRRELMLKLLSMNLYDIEGNSSTEKLVEFKKAFGRSMDLTAECAGRCIPGISKEDCVEFLYAFFPFVYGIYPYTTVTEKQKAAMDAAGIEYHHFSVYDITLSAAKKLLQVEKPI
jgi:AcrR family transcriptional regulator